MSYVFPPRIDAGNATWEKSMADDTQDPATEPGCEEVPHIVRIAGNDDDVQFTLTPFAPPSPPSGICLVGDGFSDVVTTPPGNATLDWERIVGLCQKLQRTPQNIWRVEELLGLHAIGDNRDRISRIAKELSEKPSYLDNAEAVVSLGS